MSESKTEIVRRVAELARLDVAPAEAEALGRQFERILEHFEVLARIDVEGVEPMVGGGDEHGVLREDRPVPSLPPDRMLQNAPARVDDFYSVPKTVGGAE